jgi:hypothetical protein
MSDIPILGSGNTPADQGTYTEVRDEGPKIRLLYCYNCKTIEELPDFEGRPEDDTLLELLVEKHQSAGIPHTGFLSKIGVKIWSQEKYKKEIIKNLRTRVGGGLADLDPDYYTTKATFYDDAMKCYNLHMRPVGACGDWRDSKKRLIPKSTAELRKEVGLQSAAQSASTNVYLCDFCPVKTYYVTRQREEKGLYN